LLALLAAVTLALPAPELPKLPEIRREPQVTYLDRTGAVIGVRRGRYGPPVDLSRLPAHVPAAFVAIEDRRFYDHTGFDPLGIGRAVMANLAEGRTAQGASTITQQLVKNLFLTSDQTVERKAREVLLAVQMERTYSKRQILSMYLSRVYFASGAYGLEAASRRYFNKPAAQLSIREAATLAGVLKSPTNYNPVEHRQRADQRARLVLDAMVETGAISPAQRSQALARPLKVWATAPTAPAQYFVDWLDGQTQSLVGAPRQDLVVETTLDLGLETAAASAMKTVLAARADQKVEQAALVSVDGAGRVRALVGGAGYGHSPYNRAVEARRQAGSAWKPFVYLAALEAGRRPEDLVMDEPVTIAGWSPQNYTETFAGAVTVEQALSQSLNTVAARLADEVGRPAVAQAARRLGVASPVNVDPAMALGAVEVSPLELAQAYAVLANGGRRVSVYGVERIRAAGGGPVLYQRKAPPQPQVVSNPPLSDLNRMLRSAVAVGTGARAAFPGYDLAGKTGTTSDYRDAWFAGYTANFATVVWMGRDDNKPMGRVTGGSAPAELWRAYMIQAVKRIPKGPIPAGPLPPPPLPAPTLAATPAPAAPVEAEPAPAT
jgi:penicillin-binding protein 1A